MTKTGATDRIDHPAILDLLARVAWAEDDGEAADLAALLTRDSVIRRIARDGTVTSWSAPGELAAFLATRRSVAAQDRQTWTLDAVFLSEPDGAVSVISRALRVATLAGGTSNVLLGDEEVRDRVVSTVEGWRLASRTIVALGAPAEPAALAEIDDDGPAPSDRVEIEALFADYAWALDTGDVDALLPLFSEDAVMQDPFARFEGKGPDGIARFFDGLFARAEFAGRIHWVSQLVLTPMPGEYRADSYAIVPASYVSGAVNLHLVAFYRDTLVRENGAWRFRARLVGPRWDDRGATATAVSGP